MVAETMPESGLDDDIVTCSNPRKKRKITEQKTKVTLRCDMTREDGESRDQALIPIFARPRFLWFPLGGTISIGVEFYFRDKNDWWGFRSPGIP